MLKLQKSIIYGPVNSRRLGKSLGVNLSPQNYKLCSFNCIYCQYGWTKYLSLDTINFQNDLPSIDDVIKKVEQALKSDLHFDYLTFSGNGEPTLYPQFTEVVEYTKKLKNRYRPKIKLALLSNSSGLMFEEILEAISFIDIPILKLDAGREKSFNEINHPAPGVDFHKIVEQMCRLPFVYIQTALIGGKPSNIIPEELEAYFNIVKKIKPEQVHLYSIERNFPHKEIFLVPGTEINRIAALGSQKTGIDFLAFYRR